MNKKILWVFIALTVLFVTPLVVSSSNCYACNQNQTYSNCCKPLKLLYTKYECGDCSHGYTASCRTLYKVYYYNYGAPKKSVFKTVPLGSDQYCKNGKFVRFNYTEWYECRKNQQHGNRIESYWILSAKGQPGDIVKEIPRYCPYGCNPNNGKCYEKPSYRYKCSGNIRLKIDNRCNNIVERKDCSRYGQVCENGACVNPPAPKFKWICSPDKQYRIWFDYVNNKEYQRTKCPQNTICSNGACINTIIFSPTPQPAPQYQWKCEWSLFHWFYWYSVKREVGTGKKIYSEKCLHGCDKTTGRCKQAQVQPQRAILKSKKTFCKPSEPGKVYMQFNYSNGTSLVRLYMSCGSCQHCVQGISNAYCSGPSSGSRTHIHYNITIRTTTSQSSTNTHTYTRNNINTHTYSGSTTHYNRTGLSGNGSQSYNPYNSGTSAYNGSQSSGSYSAGGSASFSSSQRQSWQKPGYSSQSSYNVYSRGYRRPYERAWNPVKQQCTYNSDCGAGNYCAHYASGSYCKGR